MNESQSNDLLNEYRDKIAAFCEARDWDQFHDAKELAIGMVTEASELLEIFRFKSVQECEALLHNPASRERVEDEIADVLFFILRFAGRYGINLESALASKLLKNGAKYPVELSRGSNRKYTEF